MFNDYDLVVFGAGLEDQEHYDHVSTALIIRDLNIPPNHTDVYGSIVIANRAMTEIQKRVDKWDAMGVAGVFIVQAGYEFGVSRQRQNEVVDYVHGKGLTVLQDRQGHLWFGTLGAGAVRYDGRTFQILGRADGLAGDQVQTIVEDQQGNLWFGTTTGLTRFRPPPPSHPRITIDAVVADRRHEGTTALAIPSTVSLVAFEFHGTSFKTRPDAMVYRYRLEGHAPEWRTTRARRVEYEDLPTSTYTFAVEAVDRDLGYSQAPATVQLTVHPPYSRIALAGIALLGLVTALGASGYALRKRRDQHRAEQALMQEMAKELQTAHEMQMALMPKAPPQIQGFEITGRCIPANHVGGDLFQYFQQGRKLSISLADVTGHAMEAAIPVVMFSGILKSQMEVGGSVEELFRRLNRSLHGTLTGRTFVCLAMGELDPVSRRFRFSNSGCPYPYHYRATNGEVVELRVDAYPLGVRPDTRYKTIEVKLEPGDRVVFCSDGIIEATNEAGEMFSFERTAEVIRRGCEVGLPAEGLLEQIMAEVKGFRGETPQGDDQTVVVLKVAG